MNLLKSLFVSLFVMVVGVIFMESISEILSVSRDLSWLGSLVASGTVLGFFGWLFFGKPPRTSVNLWGFTSLILLGLLISFLSGAIGVGGFSPFIFSAFVFAGWLAYIYWYSFFGNRPPPVLQVGGSIPKFEAENENGEVVSSEDFLGTPTLLLFYRGNWCPLCIAQIEEISKSYKAIADGGTKVYLISPQSPRHTKSLAKRFNIPFNFIVDKEFKLAKLLDIYHSNGTPFGIQIFGFDSDTIFPMLVISDAKNNIVYIDQTDNYRLRPEPADFLNVMDRLRLKTS